MAKPKAPLFSLSAQGTLGGNLTHQRRGRGYIARSKPSPTDPYSLPQAYQRWLYQDYAAWWQDQIPAVKAGWEMAARRLRITGFAYWMKYRLTTLPDLAGAWRFDKLTASQTPDSSPNNNHGTVFGATPAPGVIAQALSFDGVDDYVNCGTSSTLNPVDQLTIAMFIIPKRQRIAESDAWHEGYCQRHLAYIFGWEGWTDGIGYGIWDDTNTFRYGSFTFPLYINTPHHIAFTFDGRYLRGYAGGILKATTDVGSHTLAQNAQWTLLGIAGVYGKAIIDQALIANRALPDKDILRHALRRYPA